MNSVALLISLLAVSWTASAVLHKGTFLAYKNKLHNGHKLILFSLPALLLGFNVVALKPFSAGGDTYSYLVAFSRIANPFTATADAGYGPELLFWPLQALIKFFVDARGWYIINFLIVSTLYYVAYKKLTEKTSITALIFSLVFLTYFVVYGGNAMRQIYSLPLGVIAFHYAYNRSYIKYFLFTFLAVSFHWSAFVMIIAPLVFRIPSRTVSYILFPLGMLLVSVLIVPLANLLTPLIGAEWLLIKIHAYVQGGRVSHISEIWLTLNFWLCATIYILLVALKVAIDPKYEVVIKYIFLFFCLMLFSIDNTDISDRYMVHFLFVSPLAIALIIEKLPLPGALKNIVMLVVFFTVAVLVYTRESSIMALGLT